MSVLSIIMDELHDREAYLCDLYGQYYVYSYAVHAFNLFNQENKVYWEGSQLPNMRLHLMFVAPSGFMKTYYRKQMSDRSYGIFTGCKVKIGYKQELTAAAMVGSFTQFKDAVCEQDIEVEGIAKVHRDDILTIDEFSGITNAMNSTYNNQLESQLLMILDSGEVMKSLKAGNIDYITHLTLWAGVQPSKFDCRGGLGRRMAPLLFIPSKHDNRELIKAQHDSQNIRQDNIKMTRIWHEIDEWVDEIHKIKHIEFDVSLRDYYLEHDLYSFEVSYFNRLALGFELAENGAKPNMVIDAHDKRLRAVFKQQQAWRADILKGVDILQMLKLISMGGVEDKEGNVISDRRQIIQDATMVGWNAHQVNEQLSELHKSGYIKIAGHQITLVG